MAVDDLTDLPLSRLFSGPLIAAIDASVQSQTEQINLILETCFDENEEPVTVGFGYTTTELDSDTGEERPVKKRLEIPLLLFLTLPNLHVSRIEEEFSAKITAVEPTSKGPSLGPIDRPSRLKIKPSGRQTERDRETRSAFDLDIHMVAELENESTGMEILERAANSAIFERETDAAPERLEKRRNRASITAERIHESTDE